MAASIAVTGPLSSPCPGVRLTVSGLTVGTDATITVMRAWSGEQGQVRGGVSRPVVGATVVLDDFEAPFGVPITYSLTVRNASGAITGQASTAATLLDVPDVWISDPRNPGASTAVTLVGMSDGYADGALSDLQYVRDGDAPQPIGARLPVAIVGTRSAASGVPLDIECMTVADRKAALTVLTAADPVCVRVPTDDEYSLLPPLGYVTSTEVSVRPMTPKFGAGLCRIAWSVQLVRAPAGLVIVPTRTYADVLTEAATYADLPTLYATYLNLTVGG